MGLNGLGARLVTRKEWGANNPRCVNRLSLPAKFVFFCYTWSKPCKGLDKCKENVRDIQYRNIKKYKLTDIRYNFLIDEEANVYICRGWKSSPTLPEKFKECISSAIYIGFIGFFIEYPPNDKMLDAREQLVQYGVKNKFIASKHLQFHI